MAGIRGRKKTRGASPAARHGELIDHSAFRARAQEAHAAEQRDGGPVDGPGQPAARLSADRIAHSHGFAGRMRSGSMRGWMPAIFSGDIATICGCWRSARCMHRPDYPSLR